MQDLHLHLSGATDPVELWTIIMEAGLKTGAKDYWAFEKTVMMDRGSVDDLDGYLKILHQIDEAQSSPLAIERSVYNAFVSSYLNGCEYLELRWNPYKRSQKFRVDLDRLIVAARAAYERAKMYFGIRGGQIFCLGRDLESVQNEAIWKKALQYHKKGVLGIDVAGPENKSLEAITDFVHYYKTARAMDMVTTVHAGETDHKGAEDELAFVLEKLRPQRIGHGIQIHKFPKLMKKASSAGTHFEICISSNLMTKAVPNLEKFVEIFRIFEDNQLKYSINTDSTYLLRTNIRKENEIYQSLKNGPKWKAEDAYRQQQKTQELNKKLKDLGVLAEKKDKE